MTDVGLSESAKRIADAVMRGEYGGLSGAHDSDDEPASGAYGGWNMKLSKQNMVILGAVLGVVVVAGVVGGVVWYKKKHPPIK